MPDIAIALGGGGVKGIAHLGVLRGLQKQGLTVKAIAGTSAGGIIGAVIAKGIPLDDVVNRIIHLDQTEFFKLSLNKAPALLDLSGFANVLVEMLGDTAFEDLPIPFACTAVDIKAYQEVIISKGKILDAVLATMAIPGVFPPKEMGDNLLVDGGVLDPVPVSVVRWLAPTLPVIAVVLSPSPEGWAHVPSPGLESVSMLPRPIMETFSKLAITQAMNIYTSSMDISGRMLSELRLKIDKPEVIIRPKVEKFNILDKVDAEEMIKIGEDAVEESMDNIRKALDWPNAIGRYFRKVELPARLVGTEDEEFTPNE
ncbi:patatin-like phospholipase family protein [Leptolinea tardivitalis]|uniref:patatin-like phospholipase family protein n=1 Tax=Leptolinea tardivitalis TaxID=229920 RepID=UPI000782FA27|nr:patatin-like phospholipase family protein [Leptolinea tardivitalis]GAP21132.1 predicted esterase of the alpha-beta hydrolase superfamily [Leptolinea tardivitalis]